MNNSYPLRIPAKVIELAEAKAREERTDRSTALRGLIYAGAEDYIVGLLAQERISASRSAELLDVSVHRIRLLAREKGARPASTVEDHEQSLETARKRLNRKTTSPTSPSTTRKP